MIVFRDKFEEIFIKKKKKIGGNFFFDIFSRWNQVAKLIKFNNDNGVQNFKNFVI